MNYKLKSILLLVTLLVTGVSFGQTDTSVEPVFTYAEVMPAFPGGELGMMQFIQANMKYPDMEKEAGVQGTCYVTFVIEKDGSLTDAKLLRGVTGGKGCDNEALRVVRMMPKWNPGKQNGKEVRVQFNLPIKFAIREPILVATINDTSYFDAKWKTCSKSDALYYRTVEKTGETFIVKDMFMKTKGPQMVANCTTWDPVNKNGKTTFYYFEGTKKSEGNYENNTNVGTWVYWDVDGKDSSIIKYEAGGKYTLERLSKNLPYNDGNDLDGIIEVQPSFPGGEMAMIAFLQKNMVYPDKEKYQNIQGKCYVSFIVEKDGTITDIKILKGVHNGPGCDNEAMRVVSIMPKWEPGTTNGKKIRVRFNLPVKFTIR